MTIIFRNLTDQRLQEAKRIHGLKLEPMGELSAGIAYEINTPVQFIGGIYFLLRFKEHSIGGDELLSF